MYCPSCENLMPDDARHCGRCGMALNKRSKYLERIRTNFAWIWRRSWGGFLSGFFGWIIVFIISRMIRQDAGPMVNNLFAGMIGGVFLGTVGGVLEESGYKAFYGGILGAIGGALGGLINIPLMGLTAQYDALFPLSILLTWAISGACIGAVSGIIEKSRKKALAGLAMGLAGGAIGGYLGSAFYGSVIFEFKPQSWLALRCVEGLSGGLVGAVLWFSIGLVEKFYIFHRREDPAVKEKVCDFCQAKNPLRYWYCVSCGHVLPIAAPREKVETTPYSGIERIVNGLKFLSRLFGVAGAITAPVVFIIFLMQDIFLAFISLVFSVLITYFMMQSFRFVADVLSALIKTNCSEKDNTPSS